MKSVKAELQEFARGCYLNYDVALSDVLKCKKLPQREQEFWTSQVIFWQQRCAFYYAAARMCNEDET